MFRRSGGAKSLFLPRGDRHLWWSASLTQHSTFTNKRCSLFKIDGWTLGPMGDVQQGSPDEKGDGVPEQYMTASLGGFRLMLIHSTW